MNKANLLFLFSPARAWKYCGGATLICAESLEKAVRIGNELVERQNSDDFRGPWFMDSGTFVEKSMGEETCDWEFKESFVLAEPREVGLVFSDGNYA